VNDDKFVEDKGNKYIVEGIAGKGTFGVVYFGRDRVQGNKVAIKKVLQDKKYKNRELDILKILKHENVLQMRDHYFTYENGSEYLNVVMDYYSNNLYQTIKKK
jgi:serine/threonine protein kinase